MNPAGRMHQDVILLGPVAEDHQLRRYPMTDQASSKAPSLAIRTCRGPVIPNARSRPFQAVESANVCGPRRSRPTIAFGSFCRRQ